MTYRFLWDEEPTEEQLEVIMREVAEEARRKSEANSKLMSERIEQEYLLAMADGVSGRMCLDSAKDAEAQQE